MLKNFQTYMENEGLSERTITSYLGLITRIHKSMGNFWELPLEVIQDYVQAHGSSSASAHNQWVKALKKFRYFLESIGVECGYKNELSLKKRKRRLPKPLTKEEINELCNAIDISDINGLRDRALVELGYCGLRVSEICDLRFSCLQERAVRIIGKGDKERIVPLNDTAWNYVVRYVLSYHGSSEDLRTLEEKGPTFAIVQFIDNHEDDWLFFTEADNKIYPRYVRSRLYAHAKKAGVSNVHPHRLRHSFATHTLDEGLGNLVALKDVLGHASFNEVELYVLTSRSGRDLVRSFHPRQRE